MQGNYSQLKAMVAITKASLIGIFRSPSAVVFSIGFPIIFILVFGFIGGGNGFSLDVAMDKNSDTTNPVYDALKQLKGLDFNIAPDNIITEKLEKGNISAIINIQKNAAGKPAYIIHLKSSEAVNPQNIQLLQSILNSVILGIDKMKLP